MIILKQLNFTIIVMVFGFDCVILMVSISLVARCCCCKGKMESYEYFCALKNGLNQSNKDLMCIKINMFSVIDKR